MADMATRPFVRLLHIARLLANHPEGISGPADAPPLPNGMTSMGSIANRHLQLVRADVYARRLSRAYGYIGELNRVWFLPT